MGVDLMCPGGWVSFNWNAWQTLYDLGLAFGWRPAGTLPMTGQPKEGRWIYPDDDDRETPRDGYFSNDFQRVTDTDAAAWCAALERALAALEGNAPMTLEEAEALRRVWADEIEDRTPLSRVAEALAASKGFHDLLDEDEGEPLTPKQREARRQVLIESFAPPDLEPLIRAFVERVKPCRGFAIG
jgi:hypothetical protein